VCVSFGSIRQVRGNTPGRAIRKAARRQRMRETPRPSPGRGQTNRCARMPARVHEGRLAEHPQLGKSGCLQAGAIPDIPGSIGGLHGVDRPGLHSVSHRHAGPRLRRRIPEGNEAVGLMRLDTFSTQLVWRGSVGSSRSSWSSRSESRSPTPKTQAGTLVSNSQGGSAGSNPVGATR
jgi:hypothetical protein